MPNQHTNKWTEEEDYILRKYYPSEKYETFIHKLNNRSQEAIRSRVYRLGIKRIDPYFTQSNTWSGDFFKNTSDKDIAYIAGFFDADGHVRISLDKKRKHGFIRKISIRVGITNTDKDVMDWLDEKTNYEGAVYFTKRTNPKHKNIYSWQINGNNKVIDFLTHLTPYLIVKKKRAKVALKYRRNMLDKERINLYQEMKILNKRGK